MDTRSHGNRDAQVPESGAPAGSGLGSAHRSLILRGLSLLLPLAAGHVAFAVESPRSGETGEYRNLFKELLGKSEAEVESKIENAWRKLFHGDPETERIYYPIQDGMAYIPDVGNRDVRSEGLSYGMMIAVQLDKKEEPEDREFMKAAAKASRELFRKAAHPETGLMANYTSFKGEPHATRWASDEFREDAWRTLSNPALDWVWWGADPWQVEHSNRVLAFFSKQPANNWPDHLEVDGTVVRRGERSPGLYAMAACAGLAADPELARPVVQRLWDMPVPDDQGRDSDGIRDEGELRSWRYYDGLLTMIGLLEVAGRFQIHWPEQGESGPQPKTK